MRLQRLEIGDFRNIAEARVDLNPWFNAVTGANGAGKTSLLEAIYALGHGRSFRSRLADPLIRQGAKEYLVFARGLAEDQTELRLGLTKGAQSAPRVHINGAAAPSLSELARLFPVVEVDAASLTLIDEGPSYRRSFLDWGVFHVEQFPATLWSRFRRVLQQRNSLLKSSAQTDWQYWDSAFVSLCEQIDLARQQYVQRLMPVLKHQAGSLLGRSAETLEFEYFSGWNDSAEALAQSLQRNRAREMALGRTLRGAHCADLRLTIDGGSVKEHLSRGQKKLLVAALKFAQVKLYNERHSESAVLLLDDFTAELDSDSLGKVRSALGQLRCQIVAAAVEPSELKRLNPYPDSFVFHVEHGQINRLTEAVQSGD